MLLNGNRIFFFVVSPVAFSILVFDRILLSFQGTVQ